MKLFERILFPVDFSKRCGQTAGWVGELARSLGSEVTLLHVYEGYDDLELGVGSRCSEDDVFNHLFDGRREDLREFGHDCFEGVPVHRVMRCGNAPDCITACAKERDIQLIVMPTHGEGRFRRLLAGSVMLKVLHDAECAVWTTAHSDTLATQHPAQIRKILCAVDLRAESARVVHTAGELASNCGASVVLVHSIPSSNERVKQDRLRQLDSLAEGAADEISRDGGKNGLTFETRVGVGQIADTVRDYSVQMAADLVVAGHGHSRAHFGEFWSHLGTIIHETPCPVLSV